MKYRNNVYFLKNPSWAESLLYINTMTSLILSIRIKPLNQPETDFLNLKFEPIVYHQNTILYKGVKLSEIEDDNLYRLTAEAPTVRQ